MDVATIYDPQYSSKSNDVKTDFKAYSALLGNLTLNSNAWESIFRPDSSLYVRFPVAIWPSCVIKSLSDTARTRYSWPYSESSGKRARPSHFSFSTCRSSTPPFRSPKRASCVLSLKFRKGQYLAGVMLGMRIPEVGEVVMVKRFCGWMLVAEERSKTSICRYWDWVTLERLSARFLNVF